MEHRTLGRTGLSVSALGFGGAEIGFQGVPADTVGTLLNEALDAGLNVIDTAECYAGSEELIGQAVAHRRGDFHLFTKCGHSSGFDLPDWDVHLLEESIDRSLKRLRTDRVDLVQLHSCSEELLRRGEVVRVLERARDAGKTRFVGYSGDGPAARYAVTCGAFDTLQTSVSIADQEAIDLTLPLAVQHNLGVIAKRPVANAIWREASRPANTYYQPYWDRFQELKYGFLSGPGAFATALRFTLSVPGVSTAIVGTTRPGRWRANAELLAAGPLPAAEFRAIRDRWKAAAGADWVGQV
jgi:aryl-alcohol dehydrogenase-like predicted oxidoreductase